MKTFMGDKKYNQRICENKAGKALSTHPDFSQTMTKKQTGDMLLWLSSPSKLITVNQHPVSSHHLG